MLGILTYLATICLVSLVMCWGWFQWTHWTLLQSVAKLPCVLPPVPILGHLYVIAASGMAGMTRRLIDISIEAMDKGLNVVCLWCGPMPLIFVYGKEDIQKILNSPITLAKGDEMGAFGMATSNFKNTLLSSSGFIWKITRRCLTPLFQAQNLDLLTPMFNQNCRDLVANLSEHVGGKPVDLLPHTMANALRSVCNIIYGPEVVFDPKSHEFHGVMTAIEQYAEIFMRRLYRLWLKSDFIFKILYGNELNKLNGFRDKVTYGFMKVARANNEYKKKKASLDNQNTESGVEWNGPINMIEAYSSLQKTHQLTDHDLNGEIFTLFLTGTDTVSIATATGLLALAQFPDIQEKLYDEIASVVGLDADVTAQDFTRMPYLDQVSKETLRWSIIVPFILRKPAEDVQLSTCKIPKGFTVVVGLVGLQMNPKVFPDPMKFDPDRFSPENNAGRDKACFLPFSGGPRNCIAEKYAHLLMKMTIIHIVRRFKLRTSIDIATFRRKISTTMVGVDGYYVTLEDRHRAPS